MLTKLGLDKFIFAVDATMAFIFLYLKESFKSNCVKNIFLYGKFQLFSRNKKIWVREFRKITSCTTYYIYYKQFYVY